MMEFLRRILKGEETEEDLVSREPVAFFSVERVMNVMGRETLVGRVEGGIVYPGYKIKGRGVALIRAIEMEHRRVEFAVDGDKVALILEGKAGTKKGMTLEIYQS
jgi:translation elongation factor EF-1alpha